MVADERSGISRVEWSLCPKYESVMLDDRGDNVASQFIDCLVPWTTQPLNGSMINVIEAHVDPEPFVLYTVVVRAIDNVGYVTTMQSRGFIIDTTPPSTPASSAVSATNVILEEQPACLRDNSLPCSQMLEATVGARGANSVVSFNAGALIEAEGLLPSVDGEFLPTAVMDTPDNLENSLYLPRVGLIYVHWDSFVDIESGIASISVCAGTQREAVDLIPCHSFANDTSSALINLKAFGNESVFNLPFFVTVRATNNVGLSSTLNSFPLLVDVTPPEVGVVRAGQPYDYIEFPVALFGRTITISWDRIDDKESGVTAVFASVGATPGDASVTKGWVEASFDNLASQSMTVSGLTLNNGDAVWVALKACNGAGLCSAPIPTSQPIIAINNPPEVQGFTSVYLEGPRPPESEESFENLRRALSDSVDHHHNRRLADEAVEVSIDITLHDDAFQLLLEWSEVISPPTIPVVSIETTVCSWDLEGSRSCQNLLFGLGALVETAIVGSWQPTAANATGTTLSIPGPEIISGAGFVALLRATNAGGLSTIIESAPFWPDRTPPDEGFVVFMSLAHSSNVLQPLSGADFGEAVGIRSSNGYAEATRNALCNTKLRLPSNVCFTKIEQEVEVDPADAALSAADDPLVQLSGETEALQGAAFAAAAQHFSVEGVTIYDYSASEAQTGPYQLGSAPLHLAWFGFKDQESTLISFDVAIGTCPSCTDILPHTDVGRALSATVHWSNEIDVQVQGRTAKIYGADIDALDPNANATEILAIVTATNEWGLYTRSVSFPVMLDLTPPEPGYVFTPLNSLDDEITATARSNSWRTTWEKFWDFGSDINTYYWSLHECPPYQCNVENSTLVAGPVNVHLNTSYIANGLDLKNNHLYFAVVTAVNGAGLSSYASSSAVLVDSLPPRAGWIIDLANGTEAELEEDFMHMESEDADWGDGANNVIAAAWGDWSDDESGILKYEWAVIEVDPRVSNLLSRGRSTPGTGLAAAVERMLLKRNITDFDILQWHRLVSSLAILWFSYWP